MMPGELPAVRARYGLSLRTLARVIGKSATAVLAKIRGDSPWQLDEAFAVTEYIRQHHDPHVSLEQLFGLQQERRRTA